jgi:hypothetical protein
LYTAKNTAFTSTTNNLLDRLIINRWVHHSASLNPPDDKFRFWKAYKQAELQRLAQELPLSFSSNPRTQFIMGYRQFKIWFMTLRLTHFWMFRLYMLGKLYENSRSPLQCS